MSSYLLSTATNKHDLLLAAGKEIVFASSLELFAQNTEANGSIYKGSSLFYKKDFLWQRFIHFTR